MERRSYGNKKRKTGKSKVQWEKYKGALGKELGGEREEKRGNLTLNKIKAQFTRYFSKCLRFFHPYMCTDVVKHANM